MIQLSIVVPVYKVEPWIERCLRSIIEDPGFAGACELIVVNDGSPDRSIAIADRVCAGQPNVHFILQANQGLGAARNAGAASAKGEYLWFVDSDDWLTAGGLSRVLQALRLHPSVEVLNLDYVMSDGKHGTVINHALPGKVYSGKDFLACSYSVQLPVWCYVWSTAHIRTHGLRFEQGMYHEDALFTPLALYQAQRVSRLAHDCYVYNLREGSIMRSGELLKHALDMVRVLQGLEYFRLTCARSGRGARVLASYSALVVGAIYYYWKRLDTHDRMGVAAQLQTRALLRPVLRSWRLKYLFAIAAMRASLLGRATISE
jgi:glycosyltransferase involved in cell wall biosynthesis